MIVITIVLINCLLNIYTDNIYMFLVNCVLALLGLAVCKNDIKHLIGTLNLDPSVIESDVEREE